jgi:heterodisulfide reductase subunit C
MQTDLIKLIPVYVMGNKHEVPQGLTILKTLEYVGFKVKRGCGCRGGVCGACVTVYRNRDDYHLQFGLACQTVVEPNIQLVQLPYTPAHKAIYSIRDVRPDDLNINIINLYPELLRCMGCNACTHSCPMELEVMNYVSAAIRGDLKTVVDLSMECVMCGMCAARCPAELSPFNIALLIRRVYGMHVIPPASHLAARLAEIKAGKFKAELEQLKKTDKALIAAEHQKLQATKGAAV